MPQEVIPIIRVTDVARSIAFYARLGFQFEWEHRFADDLPWFVSVARGHARIYLSEHEGDAPPDNLLYLRHSDLDAIATEFDLEVHVRPWGREMELRDPDGNRLRLAEPQHD